MADVSVTLRIEGLLTFEQAAEILRMKRPSVYYLVETGKLHRVNIEERGYLLRAEVERLQKEKTTV